jgi:hypothetical protein
MADGSFSQNERFQLRVQTRFHGEPDAYTITSQSVWDCEFLRHIDHGEINGMPFFGGYHSLRGPSPA